MKIAFVDTLGLVYDGLTLKEKGLGGSESAVILMSEELAKLGFEVEVYNNCEGPGVSSGTYNGVKYLPIRTLSNIVTDILIGSRSTRAFTDFNIEYQYGVLWLHDTFCEGDQSIQSLVLDGIIDKVFTLSDFHTSYITNCDHGQKRMFEVLKRHIFQTRNGVNLFNTDVDISKKDRNLFVYNASVSKGMEPLLKDIWPEVVKNIPQAKLKVIGGYYSLGTPDEQELKWLELKETYSSDNVEFTGIISQERISKILTQASFTIYPAAFPETFGISTVESLAYNTPVITCNFGALEQTAVDDMCYKIDFPIEPNGLFPYIDKWDQVQKFIHTVISAYNDTYLYQQKAFACNKIKNIIGWDTVALQWKEFFSKELDFYLSLEEKQKVAKVTREVNEVFSIRFRNKSDYFISEPPYRKIICVVPIYNGEDYIEKCLQSINNQVYPFVKVFVVDDASTDNTVAIVKKLSKTLDLSITLIENSENKGALRNQIETLENIRDDGTSIVMLIDGDDYLVNNAYIFHKYNEIYKYNTDMTYGSCLSLADNIPLVAQPYPKEVLERGEFKNYRLPWNMPYSHLRTFKKWLFDSVLFTKGYTPFKNEEGLWYKAGGDLALFYSLLEEAAPSRIKCVTDITYVYNDLNPLNDYKINSEEQNMTASEIMSA